jgi:hypothetical protein
MQLDRLGSFKLVLRARPGERVQSEADAAD